MSKRKGQHKHRNRPQNLWGMIENVLIASMAKGQLLLTGAIIIIIIFIAKLPADKLYTLSNDILLALKNHSTTGYVLFGFILLIWLSHSKYQRRVYYRECRRLANERDKWQRACLGDKIKSSTEL